MITLTFSPGSWGLRQSLDLCARRKSRKFELAFEAIENLFGPLDPLDRLDRLGLGISLDDRKHHDIPCHLGAW